MPSHIAKTWRIAIVRALYSREAEKIYKTTLKAAFLPSSGTEAEFVMREIAKVFKEVKPDLLKFLKSR